MEFRATHSLFSAAIFRSRVISRLNFSDRGEHLQERPSEWEDGTPPSEALLTLRRISASLQSRQSRLSGVDPFELRQAVMRYTNPLRAKILLFALLHQSHQPHHHDWSDQAFLIKTYELDKLLERTLQTYSQFSELARQIQTTARQLEEPAEYRQTATALLQVLKPFYAQPALSQPSPWK
jgi:hypothetical protein